MHSVEAHAVSPDDAPAAGSDTSYRAAGDVITAYGEEMISLAQFPAPRTQAPDPQQVDLERLECENDGLRAFSSAVAHDLRSRLSALALYLTALSERTGDSLDPADRRLIETGRRLVGEMDEVLDAHLVLARCAQRTVSPVLVQISELVADEVRSLLDAGSGQAVHVAIQPDMTAVAEPDLVRIVFRQLLDNAMHSCSQECAGRIEVGMETWGGELVYFVSDNGVGFDPMHARRIFEPYERLHRERYTGSGLGLAIVQRIVDCHGGWVCADSTPGDGATFSFTLAPRRA